MINETTYKQQIDWTIYSHGFTPRKEDSCKDFLLKEKGPGDDQPECKVAKWIEEGDFIFLPTWYKAMKDIQEQRRGSEFSEDYVMVHITESAFYVPTYERSEMDVYSPYSFLGYRRVYTDVTDVYWAEKPE